MADKCKYKCRKGKVFIPALKAWQPCPNCSNIELLLETEEDQSGVSVYSKLDIPVAYRPFGSADKELLNFNGVQAYTQASVTEVGNLMERVNKEIYNHAVLSLSFYLYTSNQVDTKRFVYGAQKLALEKGMQVVPFISANTLYGLQRVGDFPLSSIRELTINKGDMKEVHPDMIHAVDGYRLVQHTDLTYFDYIHADVCFIDATANTTEKGWTGLADLLGERAKRGLPTYVIGYWGSKNPQAGRGLRYLLASDGGVTRLDLLTPYELKSSKGTHNASMQGARDLTEATTRSAVTAGLSTSDLMG